ncbi:hypothetical protein LC612_30860 [Nostoc sp. CHAB 5834]|nr:hypothetical protein [Nostoc sp. CHAB 5834]
MRLQFRSLTRPKHLAERIETVFPALTHMQAQEWAAKILGYRNWHELAGSVGPNVKETPDFDEDSDPPIGINKADESRVFYKRYMAQRKVLLQLIGAPVPDASTLFFHIDPNEPNVRFKKLAKLGRGSCFYRGLAHDLYDTPGENPVRGGGRCMNVPDIDSDMYVYYGIPEGEDEQGFIEKVLGSMHQHGSPYPSYKEEARRCLLNLSPYGVSRLDFSESAAAEQSRSHRFFFMEGDMPAGFAVVTTSACAEVDENSMFFQVTVEEAWCAWTDNEGLILEVWASSIESVVTSAIARVLWMRVGAPPSEIIVQFCTESASLLTWELVPRISEGVQEALRHNYEGQNGTFGAAALFAGVHFQEDVAM